MKKAQALVVPALILVSILSFIGCREQTDTITAMINASQAISDKDYVTLDKMINVERIAEQCVDVMYDTTMLQATKKQKRWMVIGESFTKPYLVQQTVEKFRAHVENGTVYRPTDQPEQLLSVELLLKIMGLLRYAEDDAGRVEVMAVEKVLNKEQVVLRISMEDDWSILFIIRSVDVGNHYRIVKIINIEEAAEVLLES